jgi:YHS domain-containing protein
VKHQFVIFALCAVAAQIRCAEGILVASDRIGGDLANFHGGARAWMEKVTIHRINLDKNGVILQRYDVVTYFSQKKAVHGKSQYESVYQGAKYYFSSAANQTTFAKNPAKYVPQYGAFCADGLLEGKLEDIDPKVFIIRQGKLYFCSSTADLKTFRAKEDEDIVAANRNWEQLNH